MSTSKRSALINVMVKAAEAAGKNLKRDYGELENLEVTKKGPGDFVTAADIRAEETVHYHLSKDRPSFGFLMEEKGVIEGKDPERRFIIDPIDGTSNFMHGIPHWGVCIAAEEKGKITAGVVYNPALNELFWAERGVGAYLNNRRIEVSKASALKDAAVSCASRKKYSVGEMTTFFPLVAHMRRMGSSAMEMCYVACGRLDACWSRGVEPYDIAAGQIIVSEARGRSTNIETGQTDRHNDGDQLSTNGLIHDEARKLLLKAHAEYEASQSQQEDRAAS